MKKKKDDIIILISILVVTIAILLASVAYTIKTYQNYRIDKGKFSQEILKGEFLSRLDEIIQVINTINYETFAEDVGNYIKSQITKLAKEGKSKEESLETAEEDAKIYIEEHLNNLLRQEGVNLEEIEQYEDRFYFHKRFENQNKELKEILLETLYLNLLR